MHSLMSVSQSVTRSECTKKNAYSQVRQKTTIPSFETGGVKNSATSREIPKSKSPSNFSWKDESEQMRREDDGDSSSRGGGGGGGGGGSDETDGNRRLCAAPFPCLNLLRDTRMSQCRLNRSREMHFSSIIIRREHSGSQYKKGRMDEDPKQIREIHQKNEKHVQRKNRSLE